VHSCTVRITVVGSTSSSTCELCNLAARQSLLTTTRTPTITVCVADWRRARGTALPGTGYEARITREQAREQAEHTTVYVVCIIRAAARRLPGHTCAWPAAPTPAARPLNPAAQPWRVECTRSCTSLTHHFRHLFSNYVHVGAVVARHQERRNS
jgi:hypothetical protein